VFPGGDVPRDRGVCTDVVIRAATPQSKTWMARTSQA
jgi:uncharacterized protein YijF (DUF1287 family)